MRSSILFIILVIALIPSLVVAQSFLVGTVDIHVTVQESITLSPDEIELTLYPHQSDLSTVSITNRGPEATLVELQLNIEPDGRGIRAVVEPARVSVPPRDTVFAEVIITAGGDAEPGDYVVGLSVLRLP